MVLNPKAGHMYPQYHIVFTTILQPSLIWEQDICPQIGLTLSSIVQSLSPWNSLTRPRLGLNNIWKDNTSNTRLLTQPQILQLILKNQWIPPTLQPPSLHLPSPIHCPREMQSPTRDPFWYLTRHQLFWHQQIARKMWILPRAWTQACPGCHRLLICWGPTSIEVVGLWSHNSKPPKVAPMVLFSEICRYLDGT